MIILFLGTPAAGKGTQSKMLQELLGLPLIVTGDLLRAAISKRDELGLQAQQWLEQGKLVPDSLVIQIIMKKLQEPICKEKGFMLDGFPRTLEQAITFDKFLKEQNYKLDYVLYYNLPEQAAIDRIAGRRICSQCGTVFHLKNMPPAQENICDHCHGSLIQRRDDTEEVMKERWQAYHEKTFPLVQYYSQQGILLEINADRSIQDIFTDTVQKMHLDKDKK